MPAGMVVLAAALFGFSQAAPATVNIWVEPGGAGTIAKAMVEVGGDGAAPAGHPSATSAIVPGNWVLIDSCEDAVVGEAPLAKAGCRLARYEILPDARRRDRAYPSLVRLGADGVLLHTAQFIQPGEQTGIRLLAGEGQVVAVKGEVTRTAGQWSIVGGQAEYVYVGPAPLFSIAEASVFFAADVPEWIRLAVRELLQKWNDGNARGPLAIFFAMEPGASPASLHGDVTLGNMLRMSLAGTAWDSPRPSRELRGLLERVFVHELVHVAQQRSAYSSASEAWVVEGTAEHLSRSWLHANGILAADAYLEGIERSANACLLAVGEGSWLRYDAKNAGSVPYDCGAMLSFLASGGFQCRAGATYAFDFLLSREVLGEAELIELATQCAPGPSVTSLLSDDHRELAGDVLLEAFGDAGVPSTSVDPASHGIAQEAGLASTAVFQMMLGACGGAAGVMDHGSHLVTDPIDGCLPFASARRIESAGGVPVESGIAFARSVQGACATSGRAVFEQESESFTVQCPKEIYAPPKMLIRVTRFDNPHTPR